MFWNLVSCLLLVVLCLCQGCGAAAIAYTGYKISEAQKESAEKHSASMSEMAYSNYCVQMENVNLKREKAGLKPKDIMTKVEWLAVQRIVTPAPAPAAAAPEAPAPEKKAE